MKAKFLSKCIVILCLIMMSETVRAQALNPAFTRTNGCPVWAETNPLLLRCANWQDATGGTADFYSCQNTTACTTTPGIPNNLFGNENDYNNDNTTGGYAGIYAWNDTYREYILGDINALIPGTYIVSYQASLSESSRQSVKLETYIGPSFTPITTINTALEPAGFPAKLISANFITSRTWVEVKDYYTTLSGGETSIIIGCLSQNVSTQAVTATACNGDPNSNWAYYYIDNVIITKCSGCESFTTDLTSEDCCHKLSLSQNSGECRAASVKVTANGGLLVDGKNGSQLIAQGVSGGGGVPSITWISNNSNNINDDIIFCLDKEHMPSSITIEYYTAEGRLLCRTEKIITDDYCDENSFTITPIKYSNSQGECCWKFDITADAGACPVAKIQANNRMITQELLPGNSLQGILGDCLPPEENLDITTITLYDSYGRIICQKEVPTPCGCCNPNLVKVTFEKNTNATGFCCWRVKSIETEEDACNIYGFKIERGSTLLLDRSTAYTGNPILPGQIRNNLGGFCLDDPENGQGEQEVTITLYGENESTCALTQKVCCQDNCDEGWQNDVELVAKKAVDIDDKCCFDLYINNRRPCPITLEESGIDVGTWMEEEDFFINGEWYAGPSDFNAIFAIKNNTPELRPGYTYLGRLCKDAADFHSVEIWVGGIEADCMAELEVNINCELPVPNCCKEENLIATISQMGTCPDGSCKFVIGVQQLGEGCDIHGVRVINGYFDWSPGDLSGVEITQLLPWQPVAYDLSAGTPAAEFCMHRPSAGKILVQFLAADGKTILCTREFYPFCPAIIWGKNALGVEDSITAYLTDFTVRPNPAHEKISIHIGMQNKGNVRLELVDILGRAELITEEEMLPGNHIVEYNVANYKPGVYLVRMVQNGTITASYKLVIKE